MTLTLRRPLRLSSFPIIAELGNDRCATLGIIGRGEAPALELCRKLIERGVNPQTPLHVYRGDVLALRIRSTGEGAELVVKTSNQGTPVFRRRGARGVTAPPVAPTASSLSEAPADETIAPTGAVS
jgi:hypothetical protein